MPPGQYVHLPCGHSYGFGITAMTAMPDAVFASDNFAPALLYPANCFAVHLVFCKNTDDVIGACLWCNNAKANAHVKRAVHFLCVNLAIDLYLPEYAGWRRQVVKVVLYLGVEAR